MTVASWPDHLLTIEEFEALPEFSRVIDLDRSVSLTAYSPADDFRCQMAPAVTGVFVTTELFPLSIDLIELPTGPERKVDQ